MPKINGNEIRPGNMLEHDGHLWSAVKVDHVKPGKGGAFAQVEMKNLRNGSKLNERFRSADKVERVRLEQKDQQFLYETDGRLVFMDTDTYEQVELDAEILGERRPFLQDGMMVLVEYHEAEALSATLPQKVTCRIAETEAVVKGQTASKSFKPAAPRQRRARHGAALRRPRGGYRRQYRDDGILRTRLTGPRAAGPRVPARPADPIAGRCPPCRARRPPLGSGT